MHQYLVYIVHTGTSFTCSAAGPFDAPHSQDKVLDQLTILLVILNADHFSHRSVQVWKLTNHWLAIVPVDQMLEPVLHHLRRGC